MIKEALDTEIAVDSFVAYEQFISRYLSELVDVFLVKLYRVSDYGLTCAFVTELPEKRVCFSSCMDSMNNNQLAILQLQSYITKKLELTSTEDKEIIKFMCSSYHVLNHIA